MVVHTLLTGSESNEVTGERGESHCASKGFEPQDAQVGEHGSILNEMGLTPSRTFSKAFFPSGGRSAKQHKKSWTS